jgi:hypothetical protein
VSKRTFGLGKLTRAETASEVEPVVAKPKATIPNLPVRHDDPSLAFEAKHSESGLGMANATAIVEP